MTGPAFVEPAVHSYLRHVSIERGLSANTVAAYRRDPVTSRRSATSASVSQPA